MTKSTAKRISRDRRANCAAHGFNYKYCMAQWLIQVQRKENDAFDFPIGKVQWFRTELLYHGFSILEHPDYPGYARARFLALHTRDSIITYIVFKYHHIDFEYK